MYSVTEEHGNFILKAQNYQTGSDIPIKVWKSLGHQDIIWLKSLFNKILRLRKNILWIEEELLTPIYKK